MSFTNNWENIYRTNQQLSIWPWSDLVSAVMHFAEPANERLRVLELGCGAGSNIPLFDSLDADYFGIDGSDAIIKKLKQAFPEKSHQLQVCDFTKELYFDGPFDLIIDRGSLTHNSDADIRNSVDLAFSSLHQGGRLIAIDWFSSDHSGNLTGEPAEDPYTRINFETGPLNGTGLAHFADKENIEDIFKKWKLEKLDHRTTTPIFPESINSSASWNIVVQRA
jgi:SAM-dependent methyltransferase